MIRKLIERPIAATMCTIAVIVLGIVASRMLPISLMPEVDIPQITVYNKCDKPGAAAFDPAVLLTSAKTGLGLDRLLTRLDQLLADRVRAIKVLLPYDALGLAAPLRDRGSVQTEEYRPDGLYLEAIAKREELHLFEKDMV